MARKITTGIVGAPILGVIRVDDNTFTPVIDNTNLLLTPSGTGSVDANASLRVLNENALQLHENGSTNYVAIKSPTSLSANYTLTLPANDGNSGEVLQTNGSGTLSWADPSVAISDDDTTNTTYKVILTDAASSATAINGVVQSSSKLTYNSQSGVLNTAAFACSSVNIDGGNIDGTAIGSTTASTGRFSTITETSSIVYKENVNPIEDALDAVMNLVGVTYDRKDGSTKNEAGLIKEDVEKVLPNVVAGDGIQYTKLTAYLIEAVKSLKEEVESLKGKN